MSKPLLEAALAPPALPAPPPLPKSTHRMLVVDDDPGVRQVLCDALCELGPVETADSVEAGLRALRENGPFAVLVADIELPDGSGIELLAAARAECPETSRLAHSGHGESGTVLEALNAGGVQSFVCKPAPLKELRSAVERGLVAYEERVGGQQLAERLWFARESLEDFANSLEERAQERVLTLRRLEGLLLELAGAVDMEDVVQRAAHAASRLLSGRAVELRLDVEQVGEALSAHAGPEFHGEALVHVVETPSGPLGRLFVAPEPGSASRAEQELRAAVAAATAVALQHELRRRERDEAENATMVALAVLAEWRDNETGRHLERVSAYCRLIAEGLRTDGHYVDAISEHFVEDLVRSAPLHDIGKVGVPDRVLLKPGKLDEEEWEIMRAHTTMGAETLREVMRVSGRRSGFLQTALEIAWCHHERWDGAGYPRQLAADEIPLAARILSLADCYDALTTRRPYKEPWRHEDALAYIAERAGQEYDPRAVAALVTRGDEANAIRTTMADEEPEAFEAA